MAFACMPVRLEHLYNIRFMNSFFKKHRVNMAPTEQDPTYLSLGSRMQKRRKSLPRKLFMRKDSLLQLHHIAITSYQTFGAPPVLFRVRLNECESAQSDGAHGLIRQTSAYWTSLLTNVGRVFCKLEDLV